MKCEFCEGETRKKRVKKHHWLQGKLYILENVEAQVCLECGERYFHATTLDKIDDLLKKDHPIKSHITVEIVAF